MNNYIIFDIGTHKAQELRVLNGHFIYSSLIYLSWWLDWCKRGIKKFLKLKGRILYGEGRYKNSPLNIKFVDHLELLSHFFLKKNLLSNSTIIAIDPLFYVTSYYLKRVKLKNSKIFYLPVSIKNEFSENSKIITELFIPKNNLSASLWDNNNYIQKEMCISINFSEILLYLKKHHYIKKNSKIVIRLN